MKQMTVGELKDILKELPEDLPIHINDNDNGIFHEIIHSVDHFASIDSDPEYVVIQVNLE